MQAAHAEARAVVVTRIAIQAYVKAMLLLFMREVHLVKFSLRMTSRRSDRLIALCSLPADVPLLPFSAAVSLPPRLKETRRDPDKGLGGLLPLLRVKAAALL